jgi:AbrB family looped-hinge helix DNA binding protein
MTLMRVRRAAQLTLPADVRRALNVKDGDYLEAHVMKEGVLLKPVSVVERKRAWASIKKAVSQVTDRKAEKSKSAKRDEDTITREVKAARRQHA